MTRRTKFVSVNLTTSARDAVQRATLDLSAQVGRRLSMSTVVEAAITVAQQHTDELSAALSTPKQGEDEQ
jgi:hypothetical protein